jgi:hypothetical protein
MPVYPAIADFLDAVPATDLRSRKVCEIVLLCDLNGSHMNLERAAF